MKAILNNYRQSPRKMRLVVDVVKGKTVAEARAILALLPKIATKPILKLLESAVANAKENAKTADTGSLSIIDLFVNEGATLRRFMPRAHGSGARIRKRTSQVTLVLGAQGNLNHQETITKGKKA